VAQSNNGTDNPDHEVEMECDTPHLLQVRGVYPPRAPVHNHYLNLLTRPNCSSTVFHFYFYYSCRYV